MIQNIELEEYLWDLLEGSSKEIKRRIEKNADEAEHPLFYLDGKPIIFSHTINAIQGQAGVHKSRFSQALIAVAASENGFNEDLGLSVNKAITFGLMYVDTERNLKFRFPNAMRETLKLAGLPPGAVPWNFDPCSFLKIPLRDRLAALKVRLNHKRKTWDGHILVVLDVLTDCVEDMNNQGSSRELLNFLGVMCDDYDCTFICTIHENPRSEKATGHVGTELLRKATSQLSIKEIRRKSGGSVFQLQSKKSSETSAWGDVFLSFDEERKILIRESGYEKEREEGQPILMKAVELLGDSELTNKELCRRLSDEVKMAAGTLVKKIRGLVDDNVYLPDGRGIGRKQVGKDVVYFVKNVDPFDESPEQQKLLDDVLLEEEVDA